jgi:hypothetical protein
MSAAVASAEWDELPVHSQEILDDAAERDDEADARDSDAQQRDRNASLPSFLHDEEFEASLRAWRSAASDRMHSKDDRASAARTGTVSVSPKPELDDSGE